MLVRSDFVPQSLRSARRLPLHVVTESRAAGAASGDFCVVAPRPNQKLAIVVGDVCGRGDDAAVFLPPLLPRVSELTHGCLGPASLLLELDRMAKSVLPIDRFVTAIALELDLGSHLMSVSNAAHVPALVRTSSGDVHRVGPASGPPLGISNSARYVEQRFPIGEGDLIVLVTDGLLEQVDTDLVCMPGLAELVMHAPRDAEDACRFILDALDRAGTGTGGDDVTLVCVQVATQGGTREAPRVGRPSPSCELSS